MLHYRDCCPALAVAIGAALAAGPLSVSADVKLYGKVHVAVTSLDAKGAGASDDSTSRRNTTVSSSGSRWGLDVTEKLGGSLAAIVRLESQIAVDGETASQDARNRYVGLKGNFGTILAGVHDTPFKDLSGKVELFPDYVGYNRDILAATANSGQKWDLRPANSVRYQTPSFNGLQAIYQYSADTTASTTVEDNRRRADSLGVAYTAGPLYLAYAHETHRLSTIADGGNPTETGQRLAGSYNFGAFKLVALYQDLKDLGGTVAGASSIKRKSWGVGGAYTAGNNVFKLQHYKADDLSNNAAGASQPDTGARMWTVGWDHLFSNTTLVYVAYAKTDNGTNAAFTVNAAHSDVITPATGQDPSALSLGMIVDF